MAIIIPIIVHYQLRFAVASYISELKAKGEPMDLADVLPPVTAPDQNGVPHIVNALTNAVTEGITTNNLPTPMRTIAPGKALVSWEQPDIRSSDRTNNWEQLSKVLIIAQTNIDCFQGVTNYAVLNFGLDYSREVGILDYGINLGCVKRHNCCVHQRCAIYMSEKSSEACANVHALLAIVKEWAEEQVNMSQSYTYGYCRHVCTRNMGNLAGPNVSEADLASLQKQSGESCEFVDAARQAYLAERVTCVRSMDHYLQDPTALWSYVSGGDGFARAACECYWQWLVLMLMKSGHYKFIRFGSTLIRIVETNHAFPTVLASAHTNFIQQGLEMRLPSPDSMRIDIDALGVNCLFSDDAYDSYRLLRMAMVSETVRSVAITAIALKRYELDNHQFPPTLNDLNPGLLKTNLTDYMNGQALHYRPNTNGTFLLYSVGRVGAG